MSKIEILGPKNLLVHVLETIRRSALMELDPDIQHRLTQITERQLSPLVPPDTAGEERRAYQDLDRRVGRLLALLPGGARRASYLTLESALHAVTAQVDKRLAIAEQQAHRRTQLQEELARLQQSLAFLRTVATLVDETTDTASTGYIAVALKDEAGVERLREAVTRLARPADVRTTRAADGSYIGLLTTEKEAAAQLKEALREDWIPEVPLPSYLEGRPLSEKIGVLEQRLEALSVEAAGIDERQRRFAAAWRGLYEQVHEWLRARLSVLDAGAEAFATERCFVIFGWAPSHTVAGLKQTIAARHGAEVVVQEHPIRADDLEHVPVALANPPYLKPYELLVSLLPPPRYTSFDPTPFVALFFPFFFGVILGDAGYGVVLLLVAAALRHWASDPRLRDVARILSAASIWSIALGVTYGECFGEAGASALGLPRLLDRRTAIVPMLYFTVSLGAAHVTLGMVLGLLSARKCHNRREILLRLFSLATLLMIVTLVSTYLLPTFGWLRAPLTILIALMVPALVCTGGLLAPLEFMRHLGNIVSYARLMAVGLASVLLAWVANDLAAAIQSVWLGILVGVVLHAFNLVLGVFAPTVHALRLHYVEFFSKFFEPGGRPYRPLGLGQQGSGSWMP